MNLKIWMSWNSFSIMPTFFCIIWHFEFCFAFRLLLFSVYAVSALKRLKRCLLICLCFLLNILISFEEKVQVIIYALFKNMFKISLEKNVSWYCYLGNFFRKKIEVRTECWFLGYSLFFRSPSLSPFFQYIYI